MNKTRINEFEGYLLALLATFFLATAGLIGRMLYQYEPDPLTIAAIRSVLATGLVFLGLLMFRRDLLRITWRDLWFFAVYGLLGMFLTPLCFLSAIKHTTVATATILASTSPVIVILFAAFFFREPLTRRKLSSLLLTLFGTALIIQWYHPHLFKLNLAGILFGLGASLCLAFFTLFGKRAVTSYNVWTIMFYGMVFGTLFLLLIRVPQGGLHLRYPLQIWFWFLLHTLLPAILADLCYIGSLNHLEAGKVSIILSFRIVIASLLAFLLLHERLDFLQIAGAGLVLWGIILVQGKKKATLDTTTNSEMERIKRTAPNVGTERILTVIEE